ncbi:chaplin [Streptomyces sp. NPDC006476]|uniref:chaplin n=1 Tax=Streptomyces sp. NPDC006476 TaxID=3157175 RepID=UPI0033A1BC40
MRRVTRNGVIAVAAASGAMALTAPAHADSSADGAAADSPGLISGNTVQLPVHVPVEVCGNTVNVGGLFNPASGNRCADEGGHRTPGAPAAHDSRAHGGGKDSPGVLSGNGLQLPVHLPLNVSGNTVNVVGVGNAAVDNHSANTSGDRPRHPTHRTPEPPVPSKLHPGPPAAPEHTAASLAHTGTNATLPAAAASAALILAGAVVYRRSRPRADR